MLKVWRQGAGGEPLLFHQAGDLVRLAAQADDEDRREVGVPCVAAQRAAQQLQRLAVARRGAAAAVRERDHAVDVRIRRQRLGWMSRRKWSAMARATVAEQSPTVSTPM
jgi:hypothetical protein